MKKRKQDKKICIYGKHALTEALLYAPQVLHRVYLSKEVNDPQLRKTLKSAGVNVASLGVGNRLTGITGKESHQGIVGYIMLDKLMVSYDEFSKSLKVTDNTSLLILGEIEDPHNVGAIIRSAAAFGVSGVLIPKHNQAPITGAVVKVSAGMAFRIPIVSVGNINTAVRDLKDKGFWIYGLDGKAEQTASEEKYDKPSVFILGNEAKGIREKTRDICDILLSIPINSQCESLNVAALTAIMLFTWSSQHPGALKK